MVIDGFVPNTDLVHQEIGAKMTQIADAAAVLIDLRGNHGGDPATVAEIASYFFDEKPLHLQDIVHRDNGIVDRYMSLAKLPGVRFGRTKPVYVLTSHETFSGGEDLAYTLQAHGRARVVGETTGGGAHPCRPFEIDPWFQVIVPYARSINPITKTNWEGVGVKPDIAVAADRALDEARGLALADLEQGAPKKHPRTKP